MRGAKPTGFAKPLPLGEVSPKVTERARMLTVIRGRSDSIALTKSLLIAAWVVLSCRACPLSLAFARQLPQRGSLSSKREGPAEYLKPLPLGEVSPKVTERARMLTVIRGRSDSIALTKSLLIAAWVVLSCRACPLSLAFARQLPQRGSLSSKREGPAEYLKPLPLGEPLKKKKRRRKLFAAKSASCLTRTGDTLINSQVL